MPKNLFARLSSEYELFFNCRVSKCFLMYICTRIEPFTSVKKTVMKISTALTPHDIVNKFSLHIIKYNRKIYQWLNCPSFDFKQWYYTKLVFEKDKNNRSTFALSLEVLYDTIYTTECVISAQCFVLFSSALLVCTSCLVQSKHVWLNLIQLKLAGA